MHFLCVYLLQKEEWMSRFGQNRVSLGENRGPGLRGLGSVVSPNCPLYIALSPTCLFLNLLPL